MSNIDYICNVCVLMYVIGLLFRIRQIGYYYLITLTLMLTVKQKKKVLETFPNLELYLE